MCVVCVGNIKARATTQADWRDLGGGGGGGFNEVRSFSALHTAWVVGLSAAGGTAGYGGGLLEQ